MNNYVNTADTSDMFVLQLWAAGLAHLLSEGLPFRETVEGVRSVGLKYDARG